MTVMKGGSKSVLPRRRRKADPMTQRSIAARSRNRAPCAGCKRSRQKCSGGPPDICSQCAIKHIACEPGKPLATRPTVITASFIFEDGKSSTRTRHRSNTIQSVASTVISPLDESITVLSPTSPAGPLPSSSMFHDCGSPTTQLSASLSLINFREGEAASSSENSIAAVGSSKYRSQQSSLDDQAPVIGNMARTHTGPSASISGTGLYAPSDALELPVSENVALSMIYQDGELNLTTEVHQSGQYDESTEYSHMQRPPPRGTYDQPVPGSLAAVGTTMANGLDIGSASYESNVLPDNLSPESFEFDVANLFYQDTSSFLDLLRDGLTEQGFDYSLFDGL